MWAQEGVHNGREVLQVGAGLAAAPAEASGLGSWGEMLPMREVGQRTSQTHAPKKEGPSSSLLAVFFDLDM